MPALVRALCLVLLSASLAAPALAADSYIGMAQVSRADGVKYFVLSGAYKDRARCEKLMPELLNKALVDAAPKGLTAKVEFMSCDTKAPPRSEFAALRGEAPATRVIFFTENFRAMPVAVRGGAKEEAKACDYVLQRVLTRFGISGECMPPAK